MDKSGLNAVITYKKKKKNDKKINKKIAELIATDISKKYFNKKLLF